MSLSLAHSLVGLASATLISFAVAAPAADVDLLIDHSLTETTPDGVTRKLHFQERMYRRANMVWIERVLPAGAHDAAEHAKGGHEHKHLDLAAAARQVTLAADKTISVRLVNVHDKVVINVPPPEYGNIGFDGSWDNAWHLLDPKQLKTMQAVAGKAEHYRLKKGNLDLQVEWDGKGEFPRRVESRNSEGTRHKLMVVSAAPAPKVLPWANLQGYAQKEYSDYLD